MSMEKDKRYHIVLATTIGAILLWGSVKLGGQFQTTTEVPVVLANVPSSVAPVFPIPRVLDLTVRGEGWQMVNHVWDSDLLLELDGNPQSAPRIVTLREVRRIIALPEDILLVDMKPESLLVAFEPSVEKRVPILLENHAFFAEGYGLSGRPVVDPESVTVSGAASVLRDLTAWYVATPALTDLRSPVQQAIPLSDNATYLVALSPPSVTLTLNVQPLAEKTLSGIPVSVHSLPHDREVLLIPPRIDILIRGAIDRLAGITSEECRVSVDYRDIEGDTVRSVVPLIELPEGLTVIGRTPERLQFVIRQRL
jgi:hypothetical protein